MNAELGEQRVVEIIRAVAKEHGVGVTMRTGDYSCDELGNSKTSLSFDTT